jgi:hypothetical protein
MHLRRLATISSAALLGLAGTLLGASAALAATPTTPIPPTLFGMQYQGNYPTVSFGAMGKGSGVVWPYIQPTSASSYGWSTLDNYVNTAASKGLPFTYDFEYAPGWAVADHSAGCSTLYNGTAYCAKKPDNMQNLTNFMNAFLTRYCPANVGKSGYVGPIQYFELYNEPYNIVGGGSYRLPPADLAAMTDLMYKAIKAQCPGMKIISPTWAMTTSTSDWTGGYATQYYNALATLGTDPVDVAAIHMYTNESGGTPSASLTPETSFLPASSVTIISTYAPGVPVWNTEGSWGQNTLTTDQEVGFIARWYLLHWSNGYTRHDWYQWENGTFGTLYGNSAAQTAYTQTYNWMVNNTMSTPCANTSGTVWKCGLTKTNYAGLAVWNTAGNSTFTVPSGYTQYRTLGGSTVPVSGTSVTIGTQPILLESFSVSPSDTTVPSTPTNLTGSAVSSSQINLSWSASTDNVGVTGYKIFRNGTQIATVSGTSYSNTGLAANTTYSYTVAAYDAAGNTSAQSTAKSVTTPSGVVLTESVNGTLLPPATKIVDALGTTWTLVSGQIAKNGVIDPVTSGVILMAYYNHTVYQENQYTNSLGQIAHDWYAWIGGTWTPSSDPRPSTPPPTAFIVASPTSILSGGSASLTWSSSNATSCTGTNFSTGGAVANSVPVAPSVTTTYSVTCTGAGGTSPTVSTTVTVSTISPSASPSGTTIPTATQIVDSTGTVWKLVSGQVSKNNVIDPVTSGVILLLYYNNVVYQENQYINSSGQTANDWYSWTAGTWTPSSDPRPTLSPDGSTITAPTTGSLTTTAGTWTFGSVASGGYQILLNGSNTAAAGGSAIKLQVANGGKMYALNNAGTWYIWNNGWSVTTDPNSGTTPTATLTAYPTTVTTSQTSTLTWTSTNATSCTGTGFSTGGAPQGMINVSPSQTTTYSITCTGATGTSAPKTATVTVNTPLTYQIGARVVTNSALNVRKQALLNGSKPVCTQPKGTYGTITQGPIVASGYTWWKVNYDSSCDGWSVQDGLALAGAVLGAATPSASAATLTLTLAPGATGPEVTLLQEMLQKADHFTAEVTGYFGPLTEQSVKEFQATNNLSAVGIVGPLTRQLLNNLSL